MFFRTLAVCVLLAATPAIGHELWIEPEQFQVEKGAPLRADIRNGEEFEGTDLAYFENRNTRFDLVMGDRIAPVEGRMGDSPAVQTAAPDSDGLLVIAHEAAPSNLTYTEWDAFLRFAEHKDFPDAAADHVAAGWSQENFRERYTRHSKALVAVGHGAGTDRPLGLETEFVALTNPYGEGFDGTMSVELHYQDAPRTDAQIEVFDRAPGGPVNITMYRTDDAGRAVIPVSKGHAYLFDAVVLRPAADAGETDKSPVWETLWASLTFAVPE